MSPATMYSRQRSTLRMKSPFSVFELTVAWRAGAGSMGEGAAGGGGGGGAPPAAGGLEGVEHEDRVGEHEQGLGEALGVGGGDGDARLEVAGGLVGEEADGAAGEARQAVLPVRQLEPRELALDLQQRVFP